MSIQLTISSLLITLIFSTFLILILNLLLTKKDFIKKCKIDYLQFLIVAIILKLFFPFEWSLSKQINLSLLILPIRETLNTEPFHLLSIQEILMIIYIIGVIYKIILLLIEICQIKRKTTFLSFISEKHWVSDYFPNLEKNYPIYISKYVSVPSIIGFSSTIYLPSTSFSKQELMNILHHEIIHIKKHDIMFKSFVNILTIVYWWFYPIYIFQKLVHVYLEIRVDHCVTKNMNKKEILDYAETLISVQKKLNKYSVETHNSFRTNIINDNTKILNIRIQNLINETMNSKSNWEILFLIACSTIITGFISINGSYNPPIERIYFTENELKHGTIFREPDNKTYHIVVNDIEYNIENPYGLADYHLNVVTKGS